MSVELKPWRVTDSRITYQDRWITLRSDDCVTADGISVAPFHVLEYPDWVTVVPITADGQVILVREYRHGRGAIVTGLVSGGVERHDGPDEEAALAAGRRELLEETGHTASRFVNLMTMYPNSASHNNRVVGWLALDAVAVADQHLDENEAVEIIFSNLADVLSQLESGTLVMQAIHVAALYAADRWLRSHSVET